MNSKRLFLPFFFLFLFANIALAQTQTMHTPEQTVQRLVQEMQYTGDTTVMLNYVHWPTALAGLSPEQRRELRVNTPREMYDYMKRMIQQPESVLREEFQVRTKDLTVEQRQEAKKNLEQSIQYLKKKQQSLQRRMKSAQYSIGKAKIEGSKASVPLTVTLGESTSEQTIQLTQIQGVWYLPSFSAKMGNLQNGK